MKKALEQINYLLFSWINAGPESSKLLLSIATFMACYAIVVVPLFLMRLWLWGTKIRLLSQREAVAKTIIALLIAMLAAASIAKLFPYQRPFVAGIGSCFLKHAPDTSFPSKHGTAIFTCALAFLFWYRISVGGFFMIAAIGIAWSRIYLGVHWPSDMVGAFLLGLPSCLLTQWVWNLFGIIISSQLVQLYHFLFICAIRKGWVKA